MDIFRREAGRRYTWTIVVVDGNIFSREGVYGQTGDRWVCIEKKNIQGCIGG